MQKLYSRFNCKDRHDFHQKQVLKNAYYESQKTFDKKFRFYKRQYKAKEFNEMENLASKDPNEMWKKLKALSEPKSSKAVLEIIKNDGSISTDIKDVLSRWHKDISDLFSGLREDTDLAFDDDFLEHVKTLKSEFETLSTDQQEDLSNFNSSVLNADISFKEVSDAIDKAKFGKAFLEVPNEALKNSQAKKLLHKFFNECFSNGLSPFDWSQSDIKPIPKKDKDPRDPLNNRCITIMCCIAKIYSSILNKRLQIFLEENRILVDEQNGFRAARSCMDHIFSLVTILRNRKSQGKSTFISFIDYKKAFDSVDRSLLLYKLSKVGIVGRMYSAISSLYKDPKSRVILNEFATDWFECPMGVKQGDTLSPTLFAIFINDLAEELKESGVGITIDDGDLVNVLMYADDIVLLAESEAGLQSLLDIVNLWCSRWRLDVNLLKTNVMHVRKQQKQRSLFPFHLGTKLVAYCDSYKYLGVTVTEHLNFEKTVEILCESANRALGYIVTKMIKNGGLPLSVFKILYESCVCSVSDYGGEVIGFHEYEALEKIHNRAARSFLGVTRTTPIPGLRSELGWLEPRSRNQLKMIRMYHRLVTMPNQRLTKRVFLWDLNLTNTNQFINTWSKEVKGILGRNDLSNIFALNIFDVKTTIETVAKSLHQKDLQKLKNQCAGLPKLRTYITVADFFSQKSYLTRSLSFLQRKFLAKLRLGVLALRIETGRYERPPKSPVERICKQCNLGETETEEHILVKCPKHNLIRETLFSKLDQDFQNLSLKEKFSFLLNDPNTVKLTSQFIIEAFDNRTAD